jgi:hypothetical protein
MEIQIHLQKKKIMLKIITACIRDFNTQQVYAL